MKNNIWAKIWRWLANIILVFLMLVGILIVVTFLPIKNNYKIYAVKSGSMSPTIKVGSLIVVQPTNEYKAGDIISFHSEMLKNDADVITHRISSVEAKNNLTLYTTKGDANEASDTKQIIKDQIIGKYRFKIPLIGYLLSFIKTATGLILIIIIPGTIIIYEEFNKIKKETKEIIKKRKLNKEAKNGKD